MPIVFESSLRINGLRFRSNPPIQKIKVMTRFVNKQTAGIALLTMPSSEIVSAVVNIQVIIQINRRQFSDSFFHQKLFYSCSVGRISIVMRNHKVTTSLLLSIQNRLKLRFIGCQWLFSNNISSKLHRSYNLLIMRAIHRSNYNSIWFCLKKHLIKVRKCRTIHPNVIFSIGQAPGIDIAEPYKLNYIAIISFKSAPPHIGTSDPSANQSYAHPLIRFQAHKCRPASDNESSS